MNIAIIGNSGSGKTYLAEQLSKSLKQPVVSLDEIFWIDCHFQQKRPSPELAALATTSDLHYGWIAEGVYGDIVVALLDQVDILIWLDLPWEICKKRLLERIKNGDQTKEQIHSLIDWATTYSSRSDQFSHHYHEQIYLDFPRQKFHHRNEQAVQTMEIH